MTSISFNGQAYRIDRPLSVGEMLERMGLVGKRVAVERNGEVVPRSRHSEVRVENGDRIEIIVAVGGG